MSSSPTSIGLSTSRLGSYILPSVASPRVTFHPDYTGSSARNTSLFEATVGTVEGLLLIYFAEPCLRFVTSPSTAITPLATSLMRVVGTCILGFHVPLALAVPNRRTNVESRLMLQTAFELQEICGVGIFGLLAAMGEERTGLRSDRMWIATGMVGLFGLYRMWMVFSKPGFAGAYKEIEEGEKKE